MSAHTINYPQKIALQTGIRPDQAAAVIELLETGNTLPFIARYRKEATSGLDEEQLRQVEDLLGKLRSLDERRQTILGSIQEQGALTPDLEQRILAAEKLTELEDIYQPYKPKRRTRATVARELGLQPLADLILQQASLHLSLVKTAQPFLSEAISSVDEAWAGARDIVAESINDHPDVRQTTRQKAMQWGRLRCEKIDGTADPRGVFDVYTEFEMNVDRLRPHQVLAINRGEDLGVLRVKVIVADRDWQQAVAASFPTIRSSPLAEQLQLATEDAAQRLLLPAIERDVRRELSQTAELHAIRVFAENLRALLQQPPLAGHTVLGIDPGFRTGCKVAIVDPTGQVLEVGTIYPHEPQKKWEHAKKAVLGWVSSLHVTLVAIGNGTASRETEQLVAEMIGDMQDHSGKADELHYLIVSEAGASVYSASPLARAELPELDVSLRGAVSIARRVQDPLAELVKIDPKSIGVGLYQHDTDQNQLSAALDKVVESVVNRVGVDVNTASPALLTHVAGIGPKLAERIVVYRDENGPFISRSSLREIPGMGPKSFEQCAGFIRVRGGSQPLDASAIHPESYPAATRLMELAGIEQSMPSDEKKQRLDSLLEIYTDHERLADELGCGVPTLVDILEQLVRPGRDPRQDVPLPILRSDVLQISDLSPGMRMKGTVRNVVDFGAFVDIGVKQDGLLHRSQIPRGTLLRVGDIIEVEIARVEEERGRISLTWVGSRER
ncbi:MAG: Tex family protein [Anaerolineales bacterium]